MTDHGGSVSSASCNLVCAVLTLTFRILTGGPTPCQIKRVILLGRAGFMDQLTLRIHWPTGCQR